MRKLYTNVKAMTSVAPAALSAGATNGAAVDTEGFGDAMVVVSIGATTGSPSSFTVDAKVQESSTGSGSWTDITGAAMTQATAASKTGEIEVTLDARAASKRYIRVVVTPTFSGGTAPTIAAAALVVLGNPDAAPVTNSVTAN